MEQCKEKRCMICGNNVEKFDPGGTKAEVFLQHHIIGGGYRDNCVCPHCGAWDRDRWIYYVLRNEIGLEHATGRMLHFAPEPHIVDYIKKKKDRNLDYYTCDIVPGRAMHIVDITDIQFKDETFDYIICNHVMEHIEDEAKAVSEIKRILKSNGLWFFSFPICTDMETYEDETITSREGRLKAYGQENHLRLYGYDFVSRFEKHGIHCEIFSPQYIFDDESISNLGLIKDDTIIIGRKAIM